MDEIINVVQNISLANLDLLTVGITIAAIGLLGFVVYITKPKSSTNIAFLLFCFVTMLWSFCNYISYQTIDQVTTLWLLRAVIFLGAWHSFTFFHFLYVFPLEKKKLPLWYTLVIIPVVASVSLLTLTPLIFSQLDTSASKVGSPHAVVQPLILLFILTVCILIISSFIFLIRRIIKTKGEERKPYAIILFGAVVTFVLLFACNLILPAVFGVTRFIPLGAVTIFPFAICTAYAIYKHKAFKVKNLGSTIMAFFLCVATFVEIIFAETSGQLLLRVGIFLFVLLISIQFIKNIFVLEKTKESLEEANVRLQSLDKLKSEFISLASHQVRSPLTVIKGYASTLTDGMVGDLSPKQNEIVRHIYTAAQGLASVVEDFLNVTKIEQGGMKYIFTLTDVKAITKDLVSDMKIVAEDKHLTFSSSIDEQGEYMIQADGIKIKQVFLNLIDNSIKYTKEGFVKVSLTENKHDKTIIFSVADSGVGISEETKAKLFTKFTRGEGSVLNSGGSGLGLYLAREIVTSHKGEILINSEGLGKGSVFSVVLPTQK
jgi:signal transduction histidine kinase